MFPIREPAGERVAGTGGLSAGADPRSARPERPWTVLAPDPAYPMAGTRQNLGSRPVVRGNQIAGKPLKNS